jgi:hypothetical protein
MSLLRLCLIFAFALLLALVALLPLKMVLIAAGGQDRFGYVAAYGPVWGGRVYGLRLTGEPIRETGIALDPIGLLGLQARLDWRVEDVSLRGAGMTSFGLGGRVRIENAQLTARLDRFGLAALPGLDPDEPVFLSVDRLVHGPEGCLEARGALRTNALYTLGQAYDFDGPVLEGVLQCSQDGQVELILGGESEDVSVEAEITLAGQGYSWTARARTDKGEIADALALAGFTAEDGLWSAGGDAAYASLNAR